LSSDRRALGNSSSGQCFTSLAFSADGAFLLAGGSTKYVCMYDVEEKVMLRRFQVLFTPALFSVSSEMSGLLDLSRFAGLQLFTPALTDFGLMLPFLLLWRSLFSVASEVSRCIRPV